MNPQSVIKKLKDAQLTGRGGAGFPTGRKWELVRQQPGKQKYIVCNLAEGEPGMLKDGFILEKYPEILVSGIKIALATIDHSVAFIYLKQKYYQQYQRRLKRLIKDLPIKLIPKVGGYLSGEETTLLESMEGRYPEPRSRPPYPAECGLFGCPTLVNNAETFYQVARLIQENRQPTRFYSVTGAVNNPGVYELADKLPIKKVLEQTNNWPLADGIQGLIQLYGGASGEILTWQEINRRVAGNGAIVIYDLNKIKPRELMQQWLAFFQRENCDKCTPCREGIYRLTELVRANKMDKKTITDLLFVMEHTSLCPFSKGVVRAVGSLLKKTK